MPGFDGTGPRGKGPISGGGRGYCAIALPQPGSDQAPYGYAGAQGAPVLDEAPDALAGWGALAGMPGWRRLGRGHGWGRRGRW